MSRQGGQEVNDTAASGGARTMKSSWKRDSAEVDQRAGCSSTEQAQQAGVFGVPALGEWTAMYSGAWMPCPCCRSLSA